MEENLKDKETYYIELTVPQNEIALYYEVKEFISIFNQDDYDACIQKLNHSREVMRVFEAARKDAGIIYTADK